MEIDHVVLAARNKADAERELSRAGLGIARGRTIPGLGLSNLVVPLGRSLLEIQYPNGESPAPGAPPLVDIDRRAFAAHPSTPLIPVAWLVLVEDAERLRQLAADNNAPVTEAAAEGPGFPPYALAGFGATFDRPWLPFLIHWPVPEDERPAALTAPHQRRPTGITRVDVAGPVDDIRRWCGDHPRGLHALPGTSGPRRVEVGFADGSTVTLGVAD
ncbi:VOC family protein [Streptomyces sp. 8N114]|uniref:VOC family protein n=1 Tax=Streptomyces sp. 8N114 TaxID=3457419 RepID=UPI003FD0BC1F